MGAHSGTNRHQIIRVQRTSFLGEQDGPPERELKTKLVIFFDRARWIRDAYLARVAYDGDGGAVNVALCVRGEPGQNRIFAEQVGKIFASIFGSHEHLDIIWLVPEQEAELAKVCRPFFKSASC
jgi:hypothetical protein